LVQRSQDVLVRSSKVAQMLGFYVLLEDPDANVIIALALLSALLQLVFFLNHDPRYIADQPRPLASGEDAAANRRC